MPLCPNYVQKIQDKNSYLKLLLGMVLNLALRDSAKPLTKPSTPPCEQVSDKSDDSHGLDKEVTCSLMGSKQPDVADSVTKRRSQMGLVDTDSASDSSLKKLWDNGGDIAS